MFKDITDYQAKSEQKFSVLVAGKVIASGLHFAEALRLAQKTKGAKTQAEA